MDVRLYIRVLWRFRVIVGLGLGLAIGLSLLSIVRVSASSPHFAYRKPILWQSRAVLFVSPAGYPWRTGSATIDPSSFAVIASGFATSDQVRAILERQEPGRPALVRAAAENDSSGRQLPFLDIFGTSTSPAAAIALTDRAVKALQSYVDERQVANNVPAEQRIGLQSVSAASRATVAVPRKKTLPAMIFLLVMALTVASAFVLENLRPRPEAPEAADERLAA